MGEKDYHDEDWDEDVQDYDEDFDELEIRQPEDFTVVCNHCNMEMDVDLQLVDGQEIQTYFCDNCDTSITAYFPLRE